jgi:hypothetical protein
MGSATGNFSKKIMKVSYELGCAIAKNDCITITGACQKSSHFLPQRAL